ncbi:hypothetical protein H4R20_002225 [Coemansia guatemalensis]|uniref:N-acetyltransferase domain-containing protein n=1 Tax=Coemansia guatemalensis TaxID=2761395 RepID=A0A9W8LU61_9FUNG|nr:hypothetical protein H4R20_002225 [Coemansia guatemalensis]
MSRYSYSSATSTQHPRGSIGGRKGCDPDLIPERAGLNGTMVVLIPPDEDQDITFSCLLSDPETMKFLKYMMRPSGYTREDASNRRNFRNQQQHEKKLLDFAIAIKRSSIPKSLLRMVNDREFLPPRQIPVDNDHIDIDEPYLIIGCCGLNNIDLDNRCSDAGIILDARFWRSGASTEAMYLTLKFGFETLCLHRIGIQTTEDNVGMRGWMENVVGAQVECIRKEVLYLGNDQYTDSWDYAVFDHEWYLSLKKELYNRCKAKHY